MQPSLQAHSVNNVELTLLVVSRFSLDNSTVSHPKNYEPKTRIARCEGGWQNTRQCGDLSTAEGVYMGVAASISTAVVYSQIVKSGLVKTPRYTSCEGLQADALWEQYAECIS